MVRLILLTGPIASICGGIAAGRAIHWAMEQLWGSRSTSSTDASTDDTAAEANKKSKKGRGGGKKPTKVDDFTKLRKSATELYNSGTGVLARQGGAILILALVYVMTGSFARYCWRLSKDLSNPSIIVLARLQDGRTIKVDDYREAYWWLRDNTPEDARVMAWWDYGYQISAIANRTTIADGNTWNHERKQMCRNRAMDYQLAKDSCYSHSATFIFFFCRCDSTVDIALLGMALTSPIDEGHEIAKHLADYLLVWAGGGGDDVAKSPHLARIATSVYRHHCPDDPTCSDFGFRVRFCSCLVLNFVSNCTGLIATVGSLE